jgi:membrane protein DedA with SNARE-associated domain
VGTRRYLVINAVSAAVWAVGIGLGAYYAGPPVVELVGDLGTVTAIGLGIVVALAVGAEIRRRRRRERTRAAERPS